MEWEGPGRGHVGKAITARGQSINQLEIAGLVSKVYPTIISLAPEQSCLDLAARCRVHSSILLREDTHTELYTPLRLARLHHAANSTHGESRLVCRIAGNATPLSNRHMLTRRAGSVETTRAHGQSIAVDSDSCRLSNMHRVVASRGDVGQGTSCPPGR